MAKKEWGHGTDEDEYRRQLFLRARKGELKAKTELMEKYGLRVYSDTERSKMPTYYDSGRKGSPPLTSSRTKSSGASTTRGKPRPNPRAKKQDAASAKI